MKRLYTSSCLDALMGATGSEVYLIDPATLRFTDVNPAACRNLHFPRERLLGMTPFALWPGLEPDSLARPPAGAPAPPPLQLTARRADGSTYPLAVQLCYARRARRTVILAVGTDPGAPAADGAVLALAQARFDAIAAHAPGLVCQIVRHGDGRVAFPYLSEGCHALLGVTAAELRARPERFAELILEADRQSYADSMLASAASLGGWNWEGRIWVEAWHDVKWINLRCTPQRLAGEAGTLQWDGIMANITESRQAQRELRDSRARLAELTAHSETVREQERTRIAREIHDDLGGNLTAIKMALSMLSRRLPEGDPALQDKAAYLDGLVDRTIDAVHRIARDLRPAILDFGLVAALEWQLEEFAAQSGIACRFHSSAKDIALDPDRASALFRIVQEALTNVARHAGADRVALRLARTRGHISLSIADNGRGIGPAERARPDGFGLRGMAERASALGGTLTLSHAAGGGTVVAVKIPRESPVPEATIALLADVADTK